MARRARVRTHPVPDSVVLDSGALSAAARGSHWVRAELTLAEQIGIEVHVNGVTLAEILRGHRRDTRLRAVLASALQDKVTPSTRSGGRRTSRPHREKRHCRCRRGGQRRGSRPKGASVDR